MEIKLSPPVKLIVNMYNMIKIIKLGITFEDLEVFILI